MSKMGQELEKRLDENKYELLEALKGMVEWAKLSDSGDTGMWADGYDPAIVRANKVINTVEGMSL